MKAYRGVDVQIHVYLTSALVGCEWSASRPGRFTPREGAPGTHWIGGWVDPRTGPDDVKKRENSLPYRDPKSDPSVVVPVASRYTDLAIAAPEYYIKHLKSCAVLHRDVQLELTCQISNP
jgi:hypothetical protein